MPKLERSVSRPRPRQDDRRPASSSLPSTRRMSVVAQDPSFRTKGGRILMAELEVPAEELSPGPIGYRVQVVDYDTSSGRYHGAHVLPDSFEGEPKSWKDG